MYIHICIYDIYRLIVECVLSVSGCVCGCVCAYVFVGVLFI